MDNSTHIHTYIYLHLVCECLWLWKHWNKDFWDLGMWTFRFNSMVCFGSELYRCASNTMLWILTHNGFIFLRLMIWQSREIIKDVHVHLVLDCITKLYCRHNWAGLKPVLWIQWISIVSSLWCGHGFRQSALYCLDSAQPAELPR